MTLSLLLFYFALFFIYCPPIFDGVKFSKSSPISCV